MTSADCPLRQVLIDPAHWSRLPGREQGALLRQAARAHLVASLGERLDNAGVATGERPLADRFVAARVVAAEHERRLRFALRLTHQALADADFPVVLLKGGAYLLGGFANAAGRLTSDLDLLVPEDRLGEAEALFHRAGWETRAEDDYEDSYYRQWMHELPPLVHPHHNITLDLHHNITPRTGRLRVDAAALIAASVPLDDAAPLRRLGDADLVLHLCVHLFHDGDFHAGLRQLVDLDGVLRDLADQPDFWDRLVGRADALGLCRPLHYGVHFASGLLDTPVPAAVRQRLAGSGPGWPFGTVLRAAMGRALLPQAADRPRPADRLAATLLTLRGHWLRMPPAMLLRHLLTQARRRGGLKTKEAAARQAG